ncbi:MAG: twin-arginine translocase TatA/TatE family subunit [Planctomycetes bacterium]|nr:twin-arginine translocase TatA/TatE family subunit [Planctomycetota bacterium]
MFGVPGYQEMIVILVIGLILFGRKLPEVGRQVGKAVTEFRRGLNSFKADLDRNEDLREVRGALSEVRQAVDAPRVLADPARLFDQLTDETLAAPGPDARPVPPPREGPFTVPPEPEPEAYPGQPESRPG